jgi:hypothetical protein
MLDDEDPRLEAEFFKALFFGGCPTDDIFLFSGLTAYQKKGPKKRLKKIVERDIFPPWPHSAFFFQNENRRFVLEGTKGGGKRGWHCHRSSPRRQGEDQYDIIRSFSSVC